jgi:hypothetical protein
MAGIDARDVYGYSDANVKIVPSNQALILAGEPAGRPTGGDTLLEQASRLVTGSADLKRVTILSARSDSTVVVQADYFSARNSYSHDDVSSGDEIAPAASQLPAIRNLSPNALAVVTPGLRTSSEPVTSSYYLQPTQLYAQTQRGFEDAKTSMVDVLA